MTHPALPGAVELLARSLAYLDRALAGIDIAAGHLWAPTPCARWDLARLLSHLEDSLDAFTEAATGSLDVRRASRPRAGPGGPSVAAVRAKAAALSSAWTVPGPGRIEVGRSVMAAPLLVATAALEVAVHGWDVHRATGADVRIPADLAASQLALARGVIRPSDRHGRFGPALETPGSPAADELLLAFLGRVPAAADTRPRFWEPVGVRAVG